MAKPPRWTVIVLRAWADAAGVRVRLLGTDSDDVEAEVVAASAEEAARIVESWLARLAGGAAPGPRADRRGGT